MAKKTKDVQVDGITVFTGQESLSVGERVANNEGGVWRNAIGLESTEEHRHVAKVWQDSCKPFLKLVDSVKKSQENKEDTFISLNDLQVNDDLTFKHNGGKFTEWGFNSLLRQTGIPKAMSEYLKDNSLETDLAKYINKEVAANTDSEKQILLRTRKDKEGSLLNRALLSDRYGIADNTLLMESVLDAIPEEGHNGLLASHPFTNYDDLYCNVLIPDRVKSKPDSDYGCGIAIRNSEVGKFSFQVSAFLFRAICLNGMIWDRKNSEIVVKKKHLGKIDVSDLMSQVKVAIEVGLTEGENLLNIFQMTKDIPVKDMGKLIVSLGKANTLSNAQVKSWGDAFQVEATDNVFGVINGLTRAAQQYRGETRNDMERLAGKLLSPSLDANIEFLSKRWAGYQSAASGIEEEQVQKVLLWN